MYPFLGLPTPLSPLLISAQGVIVAFPVAVMWPVVLLGSIVVVNSHGIL